MEIRYSKFNNKLNKSSNLLASVRTKIIVLLFYTIFYNGDSSLTTTKGCWSSNLLASVYIISDKKFYTT